MRVGVLFSGGKDSCLALHKAREIHEVACLISLISRNEESYMFHVPNIRLTREQAESIGLPIIQEETGGEKEKELKDLYRALKSALRKFKISGVVTGAIRSIYQASRIQRACNEIGLWCFNPLWLKDPMELLNEVIKENFKVIISGVYAYPLDEGFLGRVIDAEVIGRLGELRAKYGLNVAGEGGEIETTVLDAPFFNKKIEVTDYEIRYKNNSGTFTIKGFKMIDK